MVAIDVTLSRFWCTKTMQEVLTQASPGGLAAHLVEVNDSLTAESLTLQVPAAAQEILIRTEQRRPQPENIPSVQIVYAGRDVVPMAGNNTGDATNFFDLYYWVTNVADTSYDTWSPEESIELIGELFAGAIIQTLRDPDTGVYAQGGTPTVVHELAHQSVEAYPNDDGSTYTYGGVLRVSCYQPAVEY